MNKTVAIFTTSQGHHSIAEAVKTALTDRYQTQIFFEIDITFESYILMYKHAPYLFSAPYILSTNLRFLPVIKKIFEQKYQKKLEAFVEKHQPIALINTFWMYESVLANLSETYHIPYLNVIADPRSVHPLSVAPHFFPNVTFDEKTNKRCQEFFKDAEYASMGWFVRPEFEAAFDKKQVQKALGLRSDILTVLFAAGSEGTESILEILPNLKTDQTVQIIVACGHNASLLEKVAQQEHPDSPNVTILPLSFTQDIHRYMQAADLVVGKAGPNMIFESVATLTPFLATTHIAGQEDGNLDLIREYQIGYVEEDSQKAGQLLAEICDHPQNLATFQAPLKSLADYNRLAKNKLQKLLAEQLKTTAQSHLAPTAL